MISPKQVADKLKITPAISDKMQNAIEEWYNMYVNKLQYDEEGNKIHTLNLPYTIADEKSRLATLELKSEVFDPNAEETKEGTRAYYLNEQYQLLTRKIRHKLTPAIAMGTMAIKPVPNIEDNTFSYDYVLANEFYPISFNDKGKLIHCVFVEQIVKKNVTYTRFETHELKGGTITVKNEAYKSQANGSDINSRVNLDEVSEWANLEPQVTITSTNGIKLDRLLVATFIMPNANNIDIHSKMGVSGYANAVDLIKNANDIYSSLMWEMQGGELAIDSPRDTLKVQYDKKGNPVTILPKHEKRLFREVNISSSSGDDLYNVFNPALRDGNYLNVLTNILMNIEDNVGLARGTLSRVDVIAKTATEIKSSKQKTFQTNKAIQESLQQTLEDIIYILDIYTSLYNLAPQGEYDSKFEWDDSILVDVENELKQKQALVGMGVLMPEELRAWYNEIDLEKAFQEVQAYNELKAQYNPEPVEDETIV